MRSILRAAGAVLAAGSLLSACTTAPAGPAAPAQREDRPRPAQVAPAPDPAPEPAISTVSPAEGTYGVGLIITVRFDRFVPARQRPATAAAMTITSSAGALEAGWAWLDGKTALYRPREFWPARTTITLTSSLPGATTRTWRTGRAQLIEITNRAHTAAVTVDGTLVRTMPVSLGRPGWETRSGIKVLMEGYRVKRMTSASIGAPDFYDFQVPYAIRITDSGEFLHAAPWATGRIGRYNGSHGCTNLMPADAAWLYTHRRQFDPVITTGTGKSMETWNGSGGPWNYPWTTWKTGKLA